MNGNAMSYHFRLLSQLSTLNPLIVLYAPPKILYLFKISGGVLKFEIVSEKETEIATADLPMAFVL